MADETNTRSAATTNDADSTDQIGGLTSAFDRLAEMGPSVMALQKALVEGLVRSGEVEAKRLAALDEKDPLIEVVTQRTEQMAELRQGLNRTFELAGQIASIIGASRVLQGYVNQEDGSAAVGYTVRIVPDKGTRAQLSRQAKANTDDKGYFRIQLDLPDQPSDTGATKPATSMAANKKRGKTAQPAVVALAPITLTALAARLSRPATQSPPSAAATAPAGTRKQNTTATTNATVPADTAIQIEVLDRKGVLVFRDPAPPSLDHIATSFRYYVMPAVGSVK